MTLLLNCRILWALLCASSLVLCLYLMLPIYQKYIDFPTVTTVVETNHPIYKIDFPAVTICSNNKIIEKSLDKTLQDPKGP